MRAEGLIMIEPGPRYNYWNNDLRRAIIIYIGTLVWGVRQLCIQSNWLWAGEKIRAKREKTEVIQIIIIPGKGYKLWLWEKEVALGEVHDFVDFIVDSNSLCHGLRWTGLFTLLAGWWTISTGERGGEEERREKKKEGGEEGGRETSEATDSFCYFPV